MIRALFSIAACVCAAGPAFGQDIYERPYWVDRSVVEAQGRSQVMVPADEASFSVTFTAVASDARAALFSASDRGRLAVAAIRARGGDTTRITSEAAVTAIYREYRNGEGERVSSERNDQIDNYSAAVTLEVRVGDVGRALDARAAALAVGPEQIGDLQFRLTQSSPARLQTYRAAVQNAAARARIAADASGSPLGRLLVLQEGQGPCIGRPLGVTGTRVVRQDFEAISPIATVRAEQIEVAVGSRTLRLSAEDIARMQLPSDAPMIELSASVCAIYAIG
ncbi:MAG: SIMPL domain-containing protein [Hyphomonadaceae bacterium]|nr:SIMPL domain-containing protein [Hyphomonadaceae bacterium]